MAYKFVVFAIFLLSSGAFAAPALPIQPGAVLGGGGLGLPTDDLLSGLLNGGLLKLIPLGPILDGGLDDAVHDLVTLVRLLVEEVVQILQQLLGHLTTKQLNEVTKLLANEKLTKSQILQTLDKWIKDQDDIKLQELYDAIVKDVQGKVNATLTTLSNIAHDISPEVGDLIDELAEIIQNDALTLLEEGKLIGNLVKNLLKTVEQLLNDVKTLLDQLLSGNILNLNKLLNLDGILKLTNGGLLSGLLGKNGLVTGLLDTVTGLLGGGKSGGKLLGIL